MKKITQLVGYGMGGFIVDDTSVIYSVGGDDFIYFKEVLYNVRIHQRTPDGLPIYGIRFDLGKWDITPDYLKGATALLEHFNIDPDTYRTGNLL